MSEVQEDCPSCGSNITPEDLEQYGMCPLCYAEETFHRDMMKLKASIIIGLAILIAYGILIHWRPYSNEGLFSYHDLWGEE